jgi:hypothetical protein
MSIADQTFQESVQALANWRQFLALKKAEYTRQLERARSASQTGAPESEQTEVAQAIPDTTDPTGILSSIPLDAIVDKSHMEIPAPDLGAWAVVSLDETPPEIALEPDLAALESWALEEDEASPIPKQAVSVPRDEDFFQLENTGGKQIPPKAKTKIGNNGNGDDGNMVIHPKDVSANTSQAQLDPMLPWNTGVEQLPANEDNTIEDDELAPWL